MIHANGGSSFNNECGGGGRISLIKTGILEFDTSHIWASAGSVSGRAGTIYIESIGKPVIRNVPQIQQNIYFNHKKIEISATDFRFDNAEIEISNCTLSVNGTHTFSKLLSTRTIGNIPGSINASGGSYGGYGAGVNRNSIYGDAFRPLEPGSGGSVDRASVNNRGGAGGGSIHLLCRRLQIDGLIKADGAGGYTTWNSSDITARFCSGGSGGAILVEADSVTGNGAISANGGGAGGGSSRHVNGGGGGRIAVYAAVIDTGVKHFSNAVLVNGGAGTIYLNDSLRNAGNLICNNNGIYSSDNSTSIIGIGEGFITRLTADTLFDSTKVFSPYVTGHKILIGNVSNPMYAVTVTGVVEHGLIIDTTDGNLLTKGYIGIYLFDTIKVTGGARVTIPGKVFYNSLILNNGTFTSFDGIQTGLLLLPGTREKYNENNSLENAQYCETIEPMLLGEFNFSLRENFPITRKPVSVTALPDSANAVEKANSISDPEEHIIEIASAGTSDYYSENMPAKPTCKSGDPIYTYDKLDRVTSMISPAGVTSYEYDSVSGRLAKITSPEGKEFVYHYNKGQLEGLDFPNGITSSYTFDDNGNLNDLHYRKGNGSTVQRFQYTYDKNGMRTGMTDNDGTHDYAYDALYQITRATHPTVQNPVTELVEVEQFQYDEVGNWLNDNRIHNDLNQLIEDDSCFYSYDSDGNMTGKISKSNGDTTILTWDIENKLVEVRKPGLLVHYEYDATGRRVTKNVNGIETQFRYDGDDLILEMNDSDSVVANYTFGPGIDDPLLMHRDNNNYYYLKDGLGSVRALTDSIGNTVKEYNYSVFGKITEESGDSNLWNPFTYTGREWEKELGIYFYRARYFDPVMGRFLSEDPIGFEGGDNNFFRYVHNNSIINIDPFGLLDIKIDNVTWRQYPNDAHMNEGTHFHDPCSGRKYFPDRNEYYDPKTKSYSNAGSKFSKKFNEAYKRKTGKKWKDSDKNNQGPTNLPPPPHIPNSLPAIPTPTPEQSAAMGVSGAMLIMYLMLMAL